MQSDSSVFTLRMKHPFCVYFFVCLFFTGKFHICFELFKCEVQLGLPGLLAFLVFFFFNKISEDSNVVEISCTYLAQYLDYEVILLFCKEGE